MNASDPILTISGWTQPADALLSLAPNAEVVDYIEHSLGSMLKHAGEYDLVIGWSLGGLLARQMLSHGALKARRLVLIASPYQFVRNEHFHAAMPPDTFEQFYSNFETDTARTATRFAGLLAKDDSRAKAVMAEAAHHPRLQDTAHWLRWLDLLRDYSARHHEYNLPKTLIIHGQQDAIVPFAQAEALADKFGAELMAMPDAGHAPHLHDVDKVRSAIRDFAA